MLTHAILALAGTVFSTTTSSRQLFSMLAEALPENSPWLAKAYTRLWGG